MTSAVLIYDGECRFCQGGIAWVRDRAVPGEFEYLPSGSPDRIGRFPSLSNQDCEDAIQLVLPDGTILSGDRAVPEILRRLRGWRWLGLLFRLPGVGWIAPSVYSWVARNRYAISCRMGMGGSADPGSPRQSNGRPRGPS
ncbi:MAG: DUF393 domain-containing protein [Planctomycetota bacterium]|nr:DUF393 domain-containing protein [Planctomycetota bacterium]